jgi:hypothetical protein
MHFAFFAAMHAMHATPVRPHICLLLKIACVRLIVHAHRRPAVAHSSCVGMVDC